MRRVCLTLLVLLAACSTSSDYDPPVQRRPQERPQGMRQAATLLDVIPDDTWWRDNLIAAPLNLTTDQFQAYFTNAWGASNGFPAECGAMAAGSNLAPNGSCP